MYVVVLFHFYKELRTAILWLLLFLFLLLSLLWLFYTRQSIKQRENCSVKYIIHIYGDTLIQEKNTDLSHFLFFTLSSFSIPLSLHCFICCRRRGEPWNWCTLVSLLLTVFFCSRHFFDIEFYMYMEFLSVRVFSFSSLLLFLLFCSACAVCSVRCFAVLPSKIADFRDQFCCHTFFFLHYASLEQYGFILRVFELTAHPPVHTFLSRATFDMKFSLSLSISSTSFFLSLVHG